MNIYEINKQYKHNYIEKHPLTDSYCVHNRTLIIPPFIGTLKECVSAIRNAEKSTIAYLNSTTPTDKKLKV